RLFTMNNPQIEERIAQLKDKDAGVYWNAIRELGKIGPSAIPALIEALKDKDDSVRMNAARTLGEIGDASAVAALIEMMKDKNTAAWESASNVYVKCSSDYIESIIEYYGSACKYAAEALGDIGDASAVPALIEALKDNGEAVRKHAAIALA